ncbi:hypothetical protein C8F04DRAFT_40390 [Mycena alexandri]|uniref:Uncharacterized protein n=1 Tax=Mycena alexandri TaxID=1745969 RepID=A0AAD6SPH9_9AGAR|nr:hypothetical protein C8F04DRAFT_40390 [Mycena alexandri]
MLTAPCVCRAFKGLYINASVQAHVRRTLLINFFPVLSPSVFWIRHLTSTRSTIGSSLHSGTTKTKTSAVGVSGRRRLRSGSQASLALRRHRSVSPQTAATRLGKLETPSSSSTQRSTCTPTKKNLLSRSIHPPNGLYTCIRRSIAFTRSELAAILTHFSAHCGYLPISLLRFSSSFAGRHLKCWHWMSLAAKMTIRCHWPFLHFSWMPFPALDDC